jgi:hypothetical protein
VRKGLFVLAVVGAVAASIVGTVNAFVGFASVGVSFGLAVGVVLIAIVTAVTAAASSRGRPLTVRAEFENRPRDQPPASAASRRGPTGTQIVVFLGAVAAIITIVNGTIEFFSKNV